MEVDSEILKYETFINDVLKEDLKNYEFKLSKINEEITQYYELKATTKHLITKLYSTNKNGESIQQNGNIEEDEVPVKSLMDIGCNFLMEAHVTDISKIIIHIGLEYYLEFPLKEADLYIESRLELLLKQAEHLKLQVVQVKSRIKMCLIGIGELQKI